MKGNSREKKGGKIAKKKGLTSSQKGAETLT